MLAIVAQPIAASEVHSVPLSIAGGMPDPNGQLLNEADAFTYKELTGPRLMPHLSNASRKSNQLVRILLARI